MRLSAGSHYRAEGRVRASARMQHFAVSSVRGAAAEPAEILRAQRKPRYFAGTGIV